LVLRLDFLCFLVFIGGSFLERPKGRSLRRRTSERNRTDSTPTANKRGLNPPILAVLSQRLGKSIGHADASELKSGTE